MEKKVCVHCAKEFSREDSRKRHLKDGTCPVLQKKAEKSSPKGMIRCKKIIEII